VPPPDLTAEAIDELRAFLAGLPFSGTPGDESAGMAVLDFDICVDIRSTDPMLNDDTRDDNGACNPIDIYLPPLPGQPPAIYDTNGYNAEYNTTALPWAISDGFATRNNNYYFGFNVDFSAGMSSDDRGFIGDVTAGVPVKIVGYDFDLMRIDARAQLVPDYSTKPAADVSGFSYEIRFLNQVISSMPPTKVSLSHSLLTPNLLSGEVEKFSYSDEVEKEQQMFVGPVPMIAFVFIGVNYGLDYNFGYADDAPPLLPPGSGNPVVSLGATVGPFANLEAGIGVGLGTKALSAGVEGVLTLLDIRLPYFIGADIELLNDDATAIEFITTPGQKLSLNFTGPQGAINLFVKYTTIKKATCKIGVIKYKCFKIGDVKRTLNLYTSPALFALEYILWEDTFVDPLDVVIPSGKPTAYFIEP
jgi:hypothetical protein